jgi:hypothetical protein
MSFECRICLGEEYDSEAKVVLHAIDVIKQDAGSLDVVELPSALGQTTMMMIEHEIPSRLKFLFIVI